MKRIFIIVLLLTFTLGTALAEENNETDTPEILSNLEEAFETGNPVICLFYTQKACKCTNKKCTSTLAEMKDIRDKLPEGITYCEIETASAPELVKEHRLMSPPILMIFDAEGESIARLDSWKINWENIETELDKLTEDKK